MERAAQYYMYIDNIVYFIPYSTLCWRVKHFMKKGRVILRNNWCGSNVMN